MEQNDLRAEVAGMLARLISRPNEELVCALNSGELNRLIGGYLDETTDFLNDGYTLAYLTAMYDEAMGPASAKKALPVESLYKAWCAETEAAEIKGLLMGDPAMHMIELYSSCKIELPAEFSGQPDHLALELEFLSILYEKYSDEMTLRFIADHLDWMPELLKKWRELQMPLFYIRAIETIETFTKKELMRLSCSSEVPA